MSSNFFYQTKREFIRRDPLSRTNYLVETRYVTKSLGPRKVEQRDQTSQSRLNTGEQTSQQREQTSQSRLDTRKRMNDLPFSSFESS